jgi:heterodisulfide reductase subunit A2
MESENRPLSSDSAEKQEASSLDADVLVIGAGMAGLTATFDLAEAGRRVLLVDQALAHGGTLTLLDRQFPTDSCGFCQILPHNPGEADACLKSIFRYPGVTFLPSAAVERVEGSVGAFSVEIHRRATCVDPEKCTHCGRCIEACPESYPDPLHGGVVNRKAIGYRAPVCTPSDIAVDRERCSRCESCVTACPEDAICLDAQDTWEARRVGTIVLATGFRLHDPSDHLEFGHGRFADVLTSLEFERLFGKGLLEGKEEVRRPSDGQVPSRIAWIQCVGSREEKRNYCSSVCCMIALKEARICRDLLPDAHLEIFYMDLRTCGKGYESYLNETRDRKILLTRGRPGEVLQRDGGLFLQVEGDDGMWREDPFDMVVLSVGFEATDETRRLAGLLGVPLDGDGFLSPETGSLSRTTRDGIYVAGAACEPRDIPETVMQAHEAAALAASQTQPSMEEAQTIDRVTTDPREEGLRVLVSLCDCSGTMAASMDWKFIQSQLAQESGVVAVDMGSHLCLQGGLQGLREQLKESHANALILGACTPRWLNPRLREVLASAGLDPQLCQIVNVREQGGWAHGDAPGAVTAKAIAEIRAALARSREYRPLPGVPGAMAQPGVLVLGGGPAGISAALTLSELGHPVTLVEREETLGGNLHWLHYGLTEAFRPQQLLKNALLQLEAAPGVRVIPGATVRDLRGRPGAFRAQLTIQDGAGETLRFGAVILATGAEMHRPKTFLYGSDPRILTQRDLETAITETALDPTQLREVAMIQCVGSRDEEHPHCSRICCAAALKNTIRLQEMNPQLRILVFYRDLRAFGTLERYYRKAREAGAIFVSFDPQDPPTVQLEDGELIVTALDPVVGVRVRFRPDRVILSTGVVPRVPVDLLQALGIQPDPEGFLPEVNPKFRPLDLQDGVYGCGLALGPAFLGEAMAQGRGAAMRATAFLQALKRVAPEQGARVQGARCSACGLCVASCPFDARELDDEVGHAVVHAELCQACGTCAAICPNDASQLVGYSDRQVLSAIDALLEA